MPATFYPIDEQGVDGELYVVNKNGAERMSYLRSPLGVHPLTARSWQTSLASSSAGQTRFTCIT